ncbi:copper resistance protein NlpE N-terminal domain-containing protein [Anaerophaga thermohalophila]|uniref:copper resistance protein NlpE N-terminal domain-containing protein n=1 Tax=Anaerophaga thermohalophila TaxID=177400 RepID=UPI000237CFFB|nr:copper resistance protein NlpE N-terminal domain-containing protein [Anaerophaga thermohalophila]
MKSKMILILPVSLILVLSGCSQRTSGAVSSQKNTDFPEGIYSGTLPCLDCPGIETTIVINSDGTYHLSRTYIDKRISPIEESGNIYKTEKNGKYLLESNNYNKTYILIHKEGLMLLDQNGDKIKSQPNDQYILYRKQSSEKQIQNIQGQLTGRIWQLEELIMLPDEKVKTVEKEKIFLEFSSEEKKISGFAGCNNFFGKYEIPEEGKITLSLLGSTKKFCSETMEIETLFMDMLNNCKHYTLSQDTLVLLNQNKEQLGIFTIQ